MEEERFYKAAKDGHLEEAKEILKDNPKLNVNWRNEQEHGWTALIKACEWDHPSIVSILLAHPDIRVNSKSRYGYSPFFRACINGHTSCARLLLQDSRVRVNESDISGSSPLMNTAVNGHVGLIRLWVASGREMNLGTPGNQRTDAIARARKSGKTEVVTLLERFKENPVKTRYEVRMEIGWYDEVAAEVFALVVFASDGLLQINDTTTSTPAARFFSIATRLPLEL